MCNQNLAADWYVEAVSVFAICSKLFPLNSTDNEECKNAYSLPKDFQYERGYTTRSLKQIFVNLSASAPHCDSIPVCVSVNKTGMYVRQRDWRRNIIRGEKFRKQPSRDITLRRKSVSYDTQGYLFMIQFICHRLVVGKWHLEYFRIYFCLLSRPTNGPDLFFGQGELHLLSSSSDSTPLRIIVTTLIYNVV